MKKSFYITLILVLAATVGSFAQSSFTVEYSMGFGSGDVKSYINSPSFRGFALEYKRYVQPKLSIGGEISWNVFYERRAYDTYTKGTVSVSGTQYRYINAVPILITTNYHFKPGEKISPFVGLGVGAMSMNRDTNMGVYVLSTDTWHFALKPEVGVLVSANSQLDILLSGKYYTGFATSDMPTQSYFAFNIGFVFKSGM